MAKRNPTEVKHRRFAKEYVKDFNGKQAAIRAGYAKKAARMQASRLLTHVDVQAYVTEEIKKADYKIDVQVERIIAELSKIAFSDYGGILNLTPEEFEEKDIDTSVIQEASRTKTKDGENIRIKFYSKEKALEMLGRYKAMFNDKLKIEHDASKSFINALREAHAKRTGEK